MIINTLTDRELQVFEMAGHGLGTRQIAEQLGIDMKTVDTYRTRIKEKLNLKNASELLQLAIRWNQNSDAWNDGVCRKGPARAG